MVKDGELSSIGASFLMKDSSDRNYIATNKSELVDLGSKLRGQVSAWQSQRWFLMPDMFGTYKYRNGLKKRAKL